MRILLVCQAVKLKISFHASDFCLRLSLDSAVMITNLFLLSLVKAGASAAEGARGGVAKVGGCPAIGGPPSGGGGESSRTLRPGWC